MSSGKLGYFGNVLAYAGLSTVMTLFTAGLSIGYLLGVFVIHFIFGLAFIYILTMLDDHGDWKTFVIGGIIIRIIISLIASWILGLFM